MRLYFTAYLPSLFVAAILTPATVVVIALYDWQSALIVLIALPLIPIFMVLIGLATAERSAAALAAMATLQSRLLDLVAGLPTLRALRAGGGLSGRIAELGAAHRRSAMATMRIAFLSALVLELLATLGVALVAVSVGHAAGVRRDDADRGAHRAAAGARGVLAAAPRRCGVSRRTGRKNSRRQRLPSDRRRATATRRDSRSRGGGRRPCEIDRVRTSPPNPAG